MNENEQYQWFFEKFNVWNLKEGYKKDSVLEYITVNVLKNLKFFDNEGFYEIYFHISNSYKLEYEQRDCDYYNEEDSFAYTRTNNIATTRNNNRSSS